MLVRGGAAEMIEQKDLTGARLADRVLALLSESGALQTMAAAARGFARPDASRAIAERALQLAGVKGETGRSR